ncbi:salivary peroxidase/catechol oxidase [Procambarus clarkii]|uniref:salivary peroxidase/catechol oxidase n=1 Tax=Procambarus clarkii TaxID=6728 RepID=UPI003744B037
MNLPRLRCWLGVVAAAVTVAMAADFTKQPGDKITCDGDIPLYIRKPLQNFAFLTGDDNLRVLSSLSFPRRDKEWFLSRLHARVTGQGEEDLSSVESDNSTFLPGDPSSWDREPALLPDIPQDVIDSAINAGKQKLAILKAIEGRIYNKNLTVDPKSPEWIHRRLFKPHHEKVPELAESGHILGVSTRFILTKMKENEARKQQAGDVTALDLQQLGPIEECLSKLKPFKPGSCDRGAPYRRPDGSCNNVQHPSWGAALTPFTRFLPPDYGDGVSSFRRAVDGEELPNARTITNVLNRSPNTFSNCFSALNMALGQFIDHDITFTPTTKGVKGAPIPCCTSEVINNPDLHHPECMPIILAPDDPFFGAYGRSCIDLIRSSPAHTCNFGPREQLNQITSFLDGSTIYGSDEDVATFLREGRDGLLKMQITEAGELLPASKDPNDGCNTVDEFNKNHFCFKTGDTKVNVQVLLTMVTTMWARQHNRLARWLKDLNPRWDDLTLYQETRRIVVAHIQHVVYYEYLPGIIGPALANKTGLTPGSGGVHTTDYDPKINPTLANEFSAAAFRFGHSSIPTQFREVTKDSSSASSLNNYVFHPFKVYDRGGPSSLLMGGMSQPSGLMDQVFTDEITDKLFGGSSQVGLDLIAINIVRGRDHGVPGYVKLRQACGFPAVKSFSDLADVLFPSALESLQRVYKNVGDIDLYIGGLSERPVPGGLVGPTFACIIADQFIRLKRGDRFWYENKASPKPFTTDQLRELQQVSLAQVMCENFDMETILRWPLQVAAAYNPELSCSSQCIPKFDLTHWKE